MYLTYVELLWIKKDAILEALNGLSVLFLDYRRKKSPLD